MGCPDREGRTDSTASLYRQRAVAAPNLPRLAPRRLIPACFSAMHPVSQAFPDHQLGNIAAFRLQHPAVAAIVAIEGAPSPPAGAGNDSEVEAALGNNLAQALRRFSCKVPLRCAASPKARLWRVEAEQPG